MGRSYSTMRKFTKYPSDSVKASSDFNGTSGKNTVTFNSAEEIYKVLTSDSQDLYCLDDEMYLFSYNLAGAIAYYYLDMKELMQLVAEAQSTGEGYIGALLGPGGYIIDTDNYDENPNIEYDEDITEILAFLENLVGKEFLYANVADLV